ncbi:MAG TPA: hypothetical protein VK904_00940 [Miltoncostaeaceae bacterium]|nr:hypothetical protein [Miltoncostaeaceae bacterium]
MSTYCAAIGMAFFAAVAERLLGEVERAADRGPAATTRRAAPSCAPSRPSATSARRASSRAPSPAWGASSSAAGDPVRGADLLAEARAIDEGLGTLGASVR